MIRSFAIAAALMIPTSVFAANCWTAGPNSYVLVGETTLIAGERVCEIGSIEMAGNYTIFRAGCVADALGDASLVEIIETSEATATVEWDGLPLAYYRRCLPIDPALFTTG